MEKGKTKETLLKICNMTWLDIVCRVLIGGMFLLSGVGKAMDLGNAVKAVYNFHLIPWDWAVTLIGYCLPFVELIFATCILAGAFTRLACYGIGAMSVVFFIGKFINIFIWGRSIDCGCFGELMNTMASVTIWLDIPMLILCLVLIFSANRYRPGVGQLLPEAVREKLKWVW